jgi:hypothetical protein
VGQFETNDLRQSFDDQRASSIINDIDVFVLVLSPLLYYPRTGPELADLRTIQEYVKYGYEVGRRVTSPASIYAVNGPVVQCLARWSPSRGITS